MPIAEIILADINSFKAEDAAQNIGKGNVSWKQLDASNRDELITTLKDVDLVLGFLPPKFGFSLVENCIDAGKNLIDVSYMSENPLELHDEALKANMTVVPSCGLAPGLSNMFVGHAVAKLEQTQEVHIMVGGLPEKPVPPLNYVITWSPESLIDEYTCKARIVEDGKIIEVEALSGLEKIEFESVGKLEAFYTDGLRTLLHTVGKVKKMWEKTLRYPGHAEKIRLLRDLGFFEKEKVSVEGVLVAPRNLTSKLFEEKLSKPEVKDIVVLRVEVSGLESGQNKRYIYKLLDRYDDKSRVSAMARTTAYPAVVVAELLLKGAIREVGVIPPEILAMDEKLYKMITYELKKMRIKISEEVVEEY
jgi:saccharopine dehydrogenase-like NADP-dependent oxidoreductase